MLDEAPELGEERGADRAVDDAVIARERQRKALAGDDGAVRDDRARRAPGRRRGSRPRAD